MAKYSSAKPPRVTDHPTYYVVANRTDAVFYEQSRKKPFQFVSRLRNSAGRQHEGDFITGQAGRVASSATGSVRHALQPRKTQHETSAEKFAKKIAHSLESKRQKNSFEGVVLIAEPHFLGLLRRRLPPELVPLIKHEIPREFKRGSDLQIYARIKQALRI